MLVDLLVPIRMLAAAALAWGAIVLGVGMLLMLGRDLAQTRFADGKRDQE